MLAENLRRLSHERMGSAVAGPPRAGPCAKLGIAPTATTISVAVRVADGPDKRVLWRILSPDTVGRALLMSQGCNRVEPRRAASRQVAGDQGYGQKE